MLDSIRKHKKALRRRARKTDNFIQRMNATRAVMNWGGRENKRFLAECNIDRSIGIRRPEGGIYNMEWRAIRRMHRRNPDAIIDTRKPSQQKRVYPNTPYQQ